MSENIVVDILLGAGVTIELLSCAGLVLARSFYDRLHYFAAGSSVGPWLFLAALLTREGLSAEGMTAVAAVVVLFLASPTLVHALARAAREAK